MNTNLLQELAKLTLEERLELIDGMRDDGESVQLAPEVTPAHEALLDERYRAHLQGPDAPCKTLKAIAAKLGVAT